MARNRGKIDKPQNSMKSFLRLLSYLKPYKYLVILSYFLMFLSSLGSVATGFLLKPIVNDYLIPGDFDGLIKMLLILSGVSLFTVVASFTYRRIMLDISQSVISYIRNQLFEHVEYLPISYFEMNAHGDVMSRFTNDVDNLNDALASSLLDLVSAAFTFTGTVVAMLVLSPTLFLITFISLIVMIFIAKSIGTRSRKYFREQQKYLGDLNGYIEEKVKWQKVVKVFRYESKAIENFEIKNDELKRVQTNAMAASYSMMPSMVNLTYVSYAIICVFGGLLAIRGSFDIGTLIAYLQYSRQVSGPIGNATQNINSIFSALAGAERVFEVLDLQKEVDEGNYELVNIREENGKFIICTDTRCNRWGWHNKNTDELVELKGRIEFKNVNFGYVKDKPVLKNISFYAEPGQKLAFVGSTGAGKTTIMNLINRFYEPDSGEITFDSINIKDIAKADLRRSFGIVHQEVSLFTGTIEENIEYGRKDSTKEEVIKAAELSNASSFIKHLKDGYKTVIGGSGAELSQGEKQLLSIARAAIADPPVLILDEATSSVDTRTERIIQEGMYNLMKGRTVMVIAHRLSTIHDSDAIFVLENGEIIERGNHNQLMSQRGRYYDLYTGLSILS